MDILTKLHNRHRIRISSYVTVADYKSKQSCSSSLNRLFLQRGNRYKRLEGLTRLPHSRNRHAMVKPLHTIFLALMTFYIILTLKCVTIFSHSWFVLTIDINNCSNCGQIIVTMGTLLEKAVGAFEDNTEVRDISMETAYDSDDVRSDVGNYSAIFRIENFIKMYIGLWKTSLCTEDGVYCIDLDIDTSANVFTTFPMLRKIQENIIGARQFFLLSTVIVLLTATYAIFNFTPSMSSASLIVAGGLTSAFVSLIGIVVTSLTFFSSLGMTDAVTFHFPLMLVLTLLTDYVTFAAVFSLWRTWETFNKGSVQNWFEKDIRKV